MRSTVHHPALAAAVVAALAAPLPAAAFGPSGHWLAGQIAERYLCADTRVALKPLLGGMTLAEAGLWPDWIRSEPEWEHTRPWHYVSVGDHGSVARVARQNPNNVLAALVRYEKELADPALGIKARGRALRFVTHFVVDIHQPLHVGRENDRGGNLISVRVAGRETNLHAVWDGSPLGLSADANPGQMLRRLLPASGADVTRWQQSGPLEWARESQALRAQVYGFTRPREGPADLPSAYLDQARTLVEQRLVQAGIRLAGRLNASFGAAAECGAELASP